MTCQCHFIEVGVCKFHVLHNEGTTLTIPVLVMTSMENNTGFFRGLGARAVFWRSVPTEIRNFLSLCLHWDGNRLFMLQFLFSYALCFLSYSQHVNILFRWTSFTRILFVDVCCFSTVRIGFWSLIHSFKFPLNIKLQNWTAGFFRVGMAFHWICRGLPNM